MTKAEELLIEIFGDEWNEVHPDFKKKYIGLINALLEQTDAIKQIEKKIKARCSNSKYNFGYKAGLREALDILTNKTTDNGS